MIQKLALNLDGLESTRIQKIDYSRLIQYSKYASPFLLDNLKAVNIDNNDLSKGTLYDYGCGYMWGTLGLVYNPGAKTLVNAGYDEETVINDFSRPDAWNLLWENDDYARIASIKDSIRDTYSMVDFGDNYSVALNALCAGMIGVIAWGVIAWMFGIPSSESHVKMIN